MTMLSETLVREQEDPADEGNLHRPPADWGRYFDAPDELADFEEDQDET